MNSERTAFIWPECFDLDEKTNFDEGDREEVVMLTVMKLTFKDLSTLVCKFWGLWSFRGVKVVSVKVQMGTNWTYGWVHHTPSIFCSPRFHPLAQSCGLICNNRVFQSSQKSIFSMCIMWEGARCRKLLFLTFASSALHPLSLCHPSKLWEYTSRTEDVSGNWLFIWIWYENILFCIRVYFYLRHWFLRDDWW